MMWCRIRHSRPTKQNRLYYRTLQSFVTISRIQTGCKETKEYSPKNKDLLVETSSATTSVFMVSIQLNILADLKTGIKALIVKHSQKTEHSQNVRQRIVTAKALNLTLRVWKRRHRKMVSIYRNGKLRSVMQS